MIATSWPCSTRKDNNSGALLGNKSAWDILSLIHINNPPSCLNIFSNCVNIDWILIMGFHPINVGSLDWTDQGCFNWTCGSMHGWCSHMRDNSYMHSPKVCWLSWAPAMPQSWDRLEHCPDQGGVMKGESSINVYAIRSIARPNQPWIRLWGKSSCLSALVMCVCIALIFAKSGQSITEGGFLRNPAASSKMMSWVIVGDERDLARTGGAIKRRLTRTVGVQCSFNS